MAEKKTLRELEDAARTSDRIKYFDIQNVVTVENCFPHSWEQFPSNRVNKATINGIFEKFTKFSDEKCHLCRSRTKQAKEHKADNNYLKKKSIN